MNIITDLESIGKLAKKRERENMRFRTFLKRHEEEADAYVQEVLQGVLPLIDCRACANCCKDMSPEVTQSDIQRMAAALSMSPDAFRQRYITQGMLDETQLNELPCPFLENNLCSLYAIRPKVCAEYPHLHKENFTHRLLGVVSNYGTCPIVFNVYERLKEKFEWR